MTIAVDMGRKATKTKNSHTMKLPYIFFSFTVDELIQSTNLKVVVYSGQLDLIVETTGKLNL